MINLRNKVVEIKNVTNRFQILVKICNNIKLVMLIVTEI